MGAKVRRKRKEERWEKGEERRETGDGRSFLILVLIK
jgi:hypothetical protein